MLKRNQILLSDWLTDYYKHLADVYDLSFSEMIRIGLCLSVITGVTKLYPDYKSNLTIEEIIELIKKTDKNTCGEEESHKLISKIYFEARKAAEFRMNKEK